MVFNGFDLTIESGTVTCINGPSGCGKTTLLNILAGITRPDSGDIKGVPDRLAMVFQEDRLCEDHSVISNLMLVSGRKRKQELETHLYELGLGDDIKEPVRNLSGGMKRRVAIARAVSYEPDLLILDEPFKGLDPELKKSVMDYVKKHTKDRTVICVTHDLGEAEYMDGRLVSLGEDAG
ncbi:MAG: ATP-binding cassette domain-containing protein [Christensenellaceae bacterium]|nr:ATP-binding cassette domain-containing protein [Christensenellaceae bacterium]